MVMFTVNMWIHGLSWFIMTINDVSWIQPYLLIDQVVNHDYGHVYHQQEGWSVNLLENMKLIGESTSETAALR